jgi:hypothetical protein
LPALGILGIVASCAGLYYLFNPAAPGTNIANMQLLAFGETFTIAGSILIAAQWRPR